MNSLDQAPADFPQRTTDDMEQSTAGWTTQIAGTLPWLVLLTGLSLVPLLPIGMVHGVFSDYFQYTFLAHCLLYFAAFLLSVILTLRLCRAVPYAGIPALALFLFFSLVIFLESRHPVVSRDALIHHLAVPRWWIEAGVIDSIPWHSWSFYPMLVNMAYVGILSTGFESACTLYHGGLLFLLASICAGWIYKEKKEPLTALAVQTLIFTTPVCLRIASAPLVDLGLAIFMATATIFAFRWSSSKGRFLYAVAVGVSLGLALSCKYNGLLACALFLPLLIVLGSRAGVSAERIFLAVCAASLLALLVFSPWLIKNVLWTGNPLYPLFAGRLGGTDNLPQVEMPESLTPLRQRLLLYGESPLEILLIPLRMVFFGEDDNPRNFDGVLTPLVIFSAAALLKARREPWIIFSFLFSILYFAFAIIQSHARTRYLSPLFAPVALLTIYGVRVVAIHAGQYRKIFLGALYTLHLIVCVVYSIGLVSKTDSLRFASGALTRDEYLAKHIPEFPLIKYVNNEVHENGRIYLLFTGNRYYYFEKPVLSSGHFSDRMLRQLAHEMSVQSLASELTTRNIRFIFENSDQRLRNFNAEEEGISENEKRFRLLYRDFVASHLELKAQFAQYALWKLREQPRQIANDPTGLQQSPVP